MQSAGIVFGENFMRIGVADGADHVGADHSALEQIDHAVVFHNIAVPLGQFKYFAENVEIVDSLIVDVVDGKERGDVLIFGQVGEASLKVDNRQCALPVVAVENIGIEVDRIHKLVTLLTRRLGILGKINR